MTLSMTHNVEKFLKFGRSMDVKGSEPLLNLNLINIIFLEYVKYTSHWFTFSLKVEERKGRLKYGKISPLPN